MFPVMMNLEGREVLVVGGGGIALRKVQSLLEAGAKVTMVASSPVEALRRMAAEGRMTLDERSYRDGEAADYRLVFAATDDREVNRRVFNDADGAGVWVNVVDDPELCSFHLPAKVRRGDLQIAVASGGNVPFAVRRLRQTLDRNLGPEWAEWVPAATRFRASVRSLGLSRSEEEACFDRFFTATVDSERLRARVPTIAEETQWLNGEIPDHRAPLTSRGHGVEPATAGFVSLVGSGPGCPGLLTVRGRQRLMAADAVVYDRLAAAALPCDLDAAVELHPVGKTAGHHPVPQEEINALLVRLAREGRKVVRLKGGDPYVFGRGGEEAEELVSEGIPFEVIPGVTSGVAAAAWMGVPVTHRREAVRLTLLTAHEALKSDGPQVRWDLLAKDPHATLVGYMGVTALPNVVEKLVAAGMDPETPAAMVEQGTTAAQRHVVSTLQGLPGAIESAGIKPPALFVIGPTVAHSERLDWFSKMPLAGQRVVAATSDTALVAALEHAGAEVVNLPPPVTPAARVVMGALPLTGCVVASAVEVDTLHDERGGAGWERMSVSWCVGEGAIRRARECGWQDVVEIEDGLSTEGVVSRVCEAPIGMTEDASG